MSRIKDVSNIKNFVDTIDEISSDVDTNLNTIKGNLTELGISSSTFNKTNLINGLRNDPTIAPINTTDHKGDVEKVDADSYVGMPLNASLLKLGVSGRDPEDPATIITSDNNSRTLTTDRTDGNITTVKRWATRCAFKFRSQDYGYDRCVYEIPTQYLMEGFVGTEGRHATTFSKYPYPEEIIMISADNDKNFIHFVNVQYLDGHYNYYNGIAYNLMIVKDRTNWGVLNDAGTEFKKYISVYANNVEDSLAFYIEDSSGIGYITFPMPDRSFGDELLNTLWDCKVIWRNDAPDRDFNITVEGEYREEYINEIDPTWTQGNMSSTNFWNSICYGNGKFVAVGGGNPSSNIYVYSTDGISWTEGTMPNSEAWQSVCYGNDKFVVICFNSKTMAYSTDGISWTEGDMSSSRYWYSVCYGNGKYVAVARSTTMAYSTDGISWTEGNMPSNQYWHSICYGNGKFVAVGNNTTNIMVYSTDGISWTEGTLPSSQDWQSVCYGNGKFVAIASTTNIMAYSTDGITWTEGTMPIVQQWQSVCYGNNKFVSVAWNTTIMVYSTDGISWTQGNMPSEQYWKSVCYGNGKYVAVASHSHIMAYIPDSEFDLLKFKESSVSTSSNLSLQSICYGNGKYVGIVYNSNIMAYSTDGISWTQGNMPSSKQWYLVCYGNGKYVAVAGGIVNSNIMAYSTDGISWIEGTMPSSRYWKSICYGNDKYVAVCNSNIMAYSTDGISWIEGDMPGSRQWTSVCYGNGKYIAVSSGSTTMAYSTDGIHWIEGNMPSIRSWYSVCYGNGKYVAVGYNSKTMAYSTDGISWTESTLPSSRLWYSVCYGNDKYVAVANNTNIYAYSTDGISWTQGSMPSSQGWPSVCYGNGKYVAAGYNSKIAYTLSDYLFHPLFDLDKINGKVVLTEESNTRLTRIRDAFDNLLEMSAKLTQVNHSTLTDHNNTKLNLYQLPEYSKSTEFNIEPNGILYRLIPWGDYYICIANTETNYTIKILDKSLSSTIDSYSNSHLSGITSIYLGGTTITESTPYRISFSIIIFYNGTEGQYRWNKIYNTFVKDPETGEITRDTGNSGSTDGLVASTKTINAVCQIANDKYLVFTDTGADLATVGDTVTVQENYGTKVKSSLLTHYGMVSIPNNAATIEANTNISFSNCGDEIFSSIQSGNLYSYDDQTQYSDDVTGYEANDEGKALTAFDTGVFTTSTGKDLLLRAKLKFTFTSDFTLA